MKKTIDINEKKSKKFCREVISIMTNYKFLLRSPNRKIIDTILSFRLLLIAEAFILLLFGMDFIYDSQNIFGISISVLVMLCLIMTLYIYFGIIKTYKTLLIDEGRSSLIMDDKGVELRIGSTKSVRLGWGQIAFIRSFKESICFIDSDVTGFLIAVSISYKNDIVNYLIKNKIKVQQIDL